MKLIILGSEYVGKTNIMKRFVDNEFVKNTCSTIGFEFRVKKYFFNNNAYLFKIWDTSGQNCSKTMSKYIYNDANCIFFVYDITDMKSFERVKKDLDNVQKNMNELPLMILIGNKCDLKNIRKVDENVASKFAEENCMIFFETSALDNINIEHVFNSALIQKKYETVVCFDSQIMVNTEEYIYL